MNAGNAGRTAEGAGVTGLDRLFGPLCEPPTTAYTTWNHLDARTS